MSNLREFPCTGLAPSNKDVAKILRDMADSIEDDKPCRNLLVITEYADGSLAPVVMGLPTDIARMIGTLQMAILKLALDNGPR